MHYKLGKQYFIRTRKRRYTGKLVSVSPQELVLKDAAWIVSEKRFNDAIKYEGKCNEVEPFIENVLIGRRSIIDAKMVS